MFRPHPDPAAVRVECGAGKTPQAFTWRGRWFGVRTVYTSWVEGMPWHHQALIGRWVFQQHRIWRVEAVSDRGVADVYDLRCMGDTWHVSAVRST